MCTARLGYRGIRQLGVCLLRILDTPHKAGYDGWICDTNQVVMPRLVRGIHERPTSSPRPRLRQ